MNFARMGGKRGNIIQGWEELGVERGFCYSGRESEVLEKREGIILPNREKKKVWWEI